jgi:alkyldihydroxyacetonephosphate synthase
MTKWWGWGDPSVQPTLDERALGVLRERIGELEPWPLARGLEEFELPAAKALPRALIDTVGEAGVSSDHEDRLRHATGRGYVDLARLRKGALETAPDAVVLPPDIGSLRRAIEVCAAEGIAVVPFGGGTSVVGGVEALRGSHGRVISLDLGALRAVSVDRRSLTARLGAGLRGPEA